MNAPIFWILLPSIGSVFLFLLQRKKMRNTLFIAMSLFFAMITYFVRIDQVGDGAFFQFDMRSTFNVLGRNFVINQGDLYLIKLLFYFNAIWGMAAIAYKKNNRVIPLGMLFSTFLLAAYSVTPFLYSALIIEVAVIFSIPLLVRKDEQQKDGVFRYLIYQTLSMPFILLAGWFLAGGEIAPVNPEQLVLAVLLLGLGFVFWLGVFPFHTWLPMVFQESSPLNAGYIFQLLLTFIFLLILKFINGFPWLREYKLLFNAMQMLGITMAVLGALAMIFQKDILKIIGYVFIHNVGVLLLSISIFPDTNIFLFTSFIGSQLVTVSLLIFTAQFLQSSSGKRGLDVSDASNWNLVAAGGVILSFLSISGMPLTIGFPPIQLLYQFMANRDFVFFVLLMKSKVLITFTAFRMIREVYRGGPGKRQLIPGNGKEWFLAALLILIIIGGIFPQFLFANFQKLIMGFENLIQ